MLKTQAKNFYRLIQGDCMYVLPKLSRIVDLVIADPPYSTPVITSYGRKKEKNYGDLSVQKYFFEHFRKSLECVLKSDSVVFLFCDARFYPILFEVFYDWETTHLLIWDKMRIGLGRPFRNRYECILFLSKNGNCEIKNGKTYADILRFKPVPVEKRLVGSQKPFELVMELIRAFTDEGDIVLDPFLGSGTTMFACQHLKRNCIGIEISPEKCEIIRERCFGRNFLDREVDYEFEVSSLDYK